MDRLCVLFGWTSYRAMAEAIGASHSTISNALRRSDANAARGFERDIIKKIYDHTRVNTMWLQTGDGDWGLGPSSDADDIAKRVEPGEASAPEKKVPPKRLNSGGRKNKP